MRYSIIFFLLICFSHAGFCQDSLAVTSNSVNYTEGRAHLIIEYKINYSGSLSPDSSRIVSVFKSYFSNTNSAFTKGMSDSQVENELIKIISANADLILDPILPADILKIIELINGENKKMEAREIYLSSHPDDLINSSLSSNMSSKEGRFSKSIVMTYRCRLLVKKKTSIRVPAFRIDLDGRVFITQPLAIELR